MFECGTDHHIRNFTSVWKQDTRIQELEEDGSQRMVERLCKEEDVGYVDLWDSFVGREDMYGRDGLHLRVSSFSRWTVRGGRQRLG